MISCEPPPFWLPKKFNSMMEQHSFCFYASTYNSCKQSVKSFSIWLPMHVHKGNTMNENVDNPMTKQFPFRFE